MSVRISQLECWLSGSSDFVRIASTLVLIASGLVAGPPVPAHCQSVQRAETASEAQQTQSTWVPTGDLNTARFGHTATLLSNGKVLVAGGAGADNGSILDSAELYDPAKGKWTFTGRLTAAHAGHTATLLPSGQVLIVGGAHTVNGLSAAELYDPDTGIWRPTASPITNRFDHTATLLGNGWVLVIGGASYGFEQYSALFDSTRDSWIGTHGLRTPRALHQATLLQDGRVLVTGGSSDADESIPLATSEISGDEGSWSNTGRLNFGRNIHTATLLTNGMVLVAGKPTAAELFDPSTGQWRITGSLGASREYHTASLLPDGKVLVVGGYGLNSSSPLKSAEIYDATSARWDNTSELNIARRQHSATLLPKGSVLVAGGVGATGALKSAELYGQVAPPGTISAGFTGSWYDPAQSGHGIFVQILSDQRFYAAWFAFNPAGTQQAWFTGVGTYSGNTASIAAVEQPAGGRWIPDFDANRVVHNPWGTLTFTFSDCDHGKVEFSSVAGYGAGSMNLTRLTQPARLSCQ
jgi:hypothetical protein